MAVIDDQRAAKRHYAEASCGGCGAQWSGVARCHCSGEGCHRLFSGITAFDAHRTAGGKCLDPTSLKKPQVLIDGIWSYPLDEQGKRHFDRLRAKAGAR